MWIQDLSNKEQTIDQIWEWHEEVTLSLKERLERITLAIKNKKFENIRESYSLMSIQEVSGRFQEIQSDMDNATCLALVAALDAALHVAIAKIITTDPAHAVTKALGSTQTRIKAPYLPEIVDKLKALHCGIEFDKVLDVVKFRHWLAHGRYWNLDPVYSGFTPVAVKMCIQCLMSCMEKNYGPMHWK